MSVLNAKIMLVFLIITLGSMQTSESREMSWKENQYIVQLASHTASVQSDFSRIVQAANYVTVKKAKKFTNSEILLIESDLSDADTVIKRLIGDFGLTIKDVSKNYIAHVDFNCSEANPVCLLHGTSPDVWGLSRIASKAPVSPLQGYSYIWSDNDDGSDVTIFVADTGVFETHDEFVDTTAEWGFTGPQLAEYEGNGDYHGHGTHVAGIAVGGQFGAAKKAKIVSVKVLDTEGRGTLYDILSGLSYITEEFSNIYHTQGYRPKYVVNLSLGFNGLVQLMDDAILHGSEMGIIYVVAAGNSAVDACDVSPASSPDAITVGATNVNDELSWFSNYGPCVDILAPGEDILSAGTDHSAHSVVYSGTSMATPFVAGMIARFLSHSTFASDVTCVKKHLSDIGLVDVITLPAGTETTPNLLLHAECNSCFGESTCEPTYGETVDLWTVPPLDDTASTATCVSAFFNNFMAMISVMIANYFY